MIIHGMSPANVVMAPHCIEENSCLNQLPSHLSSQTIHDQSHVMFHSPDYQESTHGMSSLILPSRNGKVTETNNINSSDQGHAASNNAVSSASPSTTTSATNSSIITDATKGTVATRSSNANDNIITVKGRLLYLDEFDQPRPILNAKVILWEFDYILGQTLWFNWGTTFTNSNGEFTFAINYYKDGRHEGGPDIAIEVIPTNDHVSILLDAVPLHYNPNRDYSVIFGPFNNIPKKNWTLPPTQGVDGTLVTDDTHHYWIGRDSIPIDELKAAWRLYGHAMRGITFLKTMTGYVPKYFEIFFNTRQDGPSTFQSILGGRRIVIHGIAGTSNPHVLLHEIGHLIHHDLKGGLPHVGGDHPDVWNPRYTLTTETEREQFAFIEGWASFFAAAVLKDPYGAPWVMHDDGGYEVPPLQYVIGPFDVIEGRVTSILWDLFDVSPDGLDDVTIPLKNIWKALSSMQGYTFWTFWQALLQQYQDNNNIDEIYHLIGVLVNNGYDPFNKIDLADGYRDKGYAHDYLDVLRSHPSYLPLYDSQLSWHNARFVLDIYDLRKNGLILEIWHLAVRKTDQQAFRAFDNERTVIVVLIDSKTGEILRIKGKIQKGIATIKIDPSYFSRINPGQYTMKIKYQPLKDADGASDPLHAEGTQEYQVRIVQDSSSPPLGGGKGKFPVVPLGQNLPFTRGTSKQLSVGKVEVSVS